MVGATTRRLGLGMTVAALVMLGALDLVQHYQVEPVTAFALSIARAAPVLMYRRWPVEAWLMALAAVFCTAIATVPVTPAQFAPVPGTPAEPWPWAVTSVASVVAVAGLVASLGLRPMPRLMLMVLTGVGGVSMALVLWPGRDDVVSNLVALVACAIAVVAGDLVHGRRRMAAELVEERQVSAAERELRSVVEERSRIARELHDVVAHHMSMITVQAETARYRHDDLPESAAAEFTEIARVARASLAELRGLLSALRDNGADPHRTPQPTLADLPALVKRITAAGTPVTLTVTTETTDLPQVVQLAVYRIVQEALSNVVRHAAGARTHVDIHRANNTLHIDVTNEPPPDQTHTTPKTRTGHGLTGLRERTTLLGGTFEVTQPNGGWRVRAELPL